MMHWSSCYIGTPWEAFGRSRAGCDCWGLAYVIYAAELGIGLPDYLGYASPDETAEINALVLGATSSPLWAAVTDPAPFDIAVFRRGGLASHIGVVIMPGLMIHMEGEDCAKLAQYADGRWASRLIGFYRHVERAVQTHIEEGAA